MLSQQGAMGGILDPGGYGQVPGEVKRGVKGDMDILVGAVEQEGAAIFAGDPGGAIDHSAGVAVARGVGGGGAAALVETIGRDEPRRRCPPDTYRRSSPTGFIRVHRDPCRVECPYSVTIGDPGCHVPVNVRSGLCHYRCNLGIGTGTAGLTLNLKAAFVGGVVYPRQNKRVSCGFGLVSDGCRQQRKNEGNLPG